MQDDDTLKDDEVELPEEDVEEDADLPDEEETESLDELEEEELDLDPEDKFDDEYNQ